MNLRQKHEITQGFPQGNLMTFDDLCFKSRNFDEIWWFVFKLTWLLLVIFLNGCHVSVKRKMFWLWLPKIVEELEATIAKRGKHDNAKNWCQHGILLMEESLQSNPFRSPNTQASLDIISSQGTRFHDRQSFKMQWIYISPLVLILFCIPISSILAILGKPHQPQNKIRTTDLQALLRLNGQAAGIFFLNPRFSMPWSEMIWVKD